MPELVSSTDYQNYTFTNLSSANARRGSGGDRSQYRDQAVIVIRLFLGMGIIWYFEILAFALSNHDLHPNVFVFTDTLNMCQVSIT